MKIHTAYEIASKPVMAAVKEPLPKGMGRYRLNPYEMYLTATRIVKQCESRLTALELSYARYRYTKNPAAFHALVDYLETVLGTDERSRRGVRMLVWAFFDRDIGIHRLRACLHCSMIQAVRYRDWAYVELDRLHQQVMESYFGRELRSKPPQASVVPQAGIDPLMVPPEGRSRHRA